MEGGRRQTDAAWLELRDRGGPLVMIASVRGVPDLFFLYVLWLFPRCLMVQRRLLCVCVFDITFERLGVRHCGVLNNCNNDMHAQSRMLFYLVCLSEV